MTSHTSLGQFVRARRARSAPRGEAVGVRRVRGLRREEVAVRAGVSIDYYTRIEQDRVGQPSPSVLASIATALDLDPAARHHLDRLAATKTADTELTLPPPQEADATLSMVLAGMRGGPAVIVGRRLEMLAWNDPAATLLQLPSGSERVDLVRHHFLHTSQGQTGWDICAEQQVGRLQYEAARYPDDLALEHLVAELRESSPEFERLWAEHPVDAGNAGVKILPASTGGSAQLAFTTVTSSGDTGQRLLLQAAQ